MSGNLPKVIEHRRQSTMRLAKLPKITQLRSGITERSVNWLKSPSS